MLEIAPSLVGVARTLSELNSPMSLRALSRQVSPDRLLVVSSFELLPVFRTHTEGVILNVGIEELRVSSIQTCRPAGQD